MNENKPKRETVGNNGVIHLSRGFAVPMIVIFMTLLVVFGILWFGVLVADFAFDVAVNPIIQRFDPGAEEIDVMSIMSPPTSEEQAAKVYATFPTLDVEAIKKAFTEALDTAPESGDAKDIAAWVSDDLKGALDRSLAIISGTIETYPQGLESWYNDHLPFRSLIFNANERAENYIELGYSDLQNKGAQMIINATNAYKVLTGEAVIGSPSISGPSDDFDDDFDEVFDDQTESEYESGSSDSGEDESGNEGGNESENESEGSKSHSYEMLSLNGGDVLCGMSYTQKCTECGYTDGKERVKTHSAGEVIKTVEPSYTTYGYTLVRCKDCLCEYRKDLKNKLRDSSFRLPVYHSKNPQEPRQVMEGRYQWLFYGLDNSQAYFEGTNLMSDAQLQEYVAVMTELNDICKEKGITLQICIWPNKDQVYPEYVTWEPVTNEKRVDRLVKYVQANSDVKIIYPLKQLKAAKPYFDTYLQYDTHWNSAGGFVGYQAMMKSLGLETMDVKNAPIYEYTGGAPLASDHYYTQVWGDMIGLGGLSTSNLESGHNYYVKYRPEVTLDTKVGGNGASDTRHTTAKNATYDCNFVMLGDSYRVMQLGYLEKDFSDCFLASRSSVNNEDVKEAIKNSDILVIASVERSEQNILSTAQAIIKILQEE